MIEYYTGDVIKAFKEHQKDCVLIHGCNCFHTMGAGIAKQIKTQYPDAYKKDMLTPYGDVHKLGTYSHLDLGYNKSIYNLYTQYMPGPNFEYAAFIWAISELSHALIFTKQLTLFTPRIGAGIGKGNWEIIESIFNSEVSELITIKIYSLKD